MDQQTLFESLRRYAVIPVIAIDSAESALPMADAMIDGGLPVAEITFRTAVARDVITMLRKARPDLIVGAGTILTLENLRMAAECGARFGVAPGLNREIVEEARRLRLPFIPGVVTPSEIEAALRLGASTLKFFPAEASGGVAMIKALAAPYAHMGIRFMPTGGVNVQNLDKYLALDAVAMVGGTWIASREAIAAQRWDEIGQNCRDARTVVERVRGHK
jgi:2-dehydro-3-deoxyphosphogluconate aldolase/(4S)-4-hydroxy-2-oxoglutarate aldolase